MSDTRLMSDAELAELFHRADELDRGAYEHSLDHEDVAKILAHIDALAAELERWQDHAYKATERADAPSEQRAFPGWDDRLVERVTARQVRAQGKGEQRTLIRVWVLA